MLHGVQQPLLSHGLLETRLFRVYHVRRLDLIPTVQLFHAHGHRVTIRLYSCSGMGREN